jgi:hypothetical protein
MALVPFDNNAQGFHTSPLIVRETNGAATAENPRPSQVAGSGVRDQKSKLVKKFWRQFFSESLP